jgi:hypothetical protein
VCGAAVVLDRDAEGTVTVKEHGGGLVVGLFAPPLLMATAVGAGIGADICKIMKRHEEKAIGVEAEDWLPAGSSAIVSEGGDDIAKVVDS